MNEEKKRRTGAFFTPTIWVDEAHKMIEENLGKDWKEKYIVWDPAWGTGNLTRDYKFKELYCSTIEASDIHTANQMGYNPEAVKFQYDFLNDGIFLNEETGEYVIDVDMDNKLPQGLKNAIQEGKPIVILMNPPYAMASTMGKDDSHKMNVAKNKLNAIMLKSGCGKSASQLYSQFLYRLTFYENIISCIYSPCLYLTGSAFTKFRNLFLSKFNFLDGFLFDATNFSDVSQDWGILFSIFKNDENKIRKFFNVKILTLNKKTFTIEKIGNKNIYNLDNQISGSDWVKKEIKLLDKKVLLPHLKSFNNISDRANQMVCENTLGVACFLSNNVYKNNMGVSFMSSIQTQGNAVISLSIIKENFLNMNSLFTARKCIMPNWINCKDEYLAPNEEHPSWQQFQYDSLVYSLFNNSSQQSSLRQVEYKGKLWDIKNEFFWLSKEKMKKLAEESDFDALYQDARTSDERYVYELLFGEQDIYNKLSPDAKLVLDAATSLIEKSMSMRKVMSEEHPEYHLQAWDAGYAQMKLVWKKHFPEEFKKFRLLYKKFEDRMRPLVYELGFLLK